MLMKRGKAEVSTKDKQGRIKEEWTERERENLICCNCLPAVTTLMVTMLLPRSVAMLGLLAFARQKILLLHSAVQYFMNFFFLVFYTILN